MKGAAKIDIGLLGKVSLNIVKRPQEEHKYMRLRHENKKKNIAKQKNISLGLLRDSR